VQLYTVLRDVQTRRMIFFNMTPGAALKWWYTLPGIRGTLP
jgi:hypothetical protein